MIVNIVFGFIEKKITFITEKEKLTHFPPNEEYELVINLFINPYSACRVVFCFANHLKL